MREQVAGCVDGQARVLAHVDTQLVEDAQFVGLSALSATGGAYVWTSLAEQKVSAYRAICPPRWYATTTVYRDPWPAALPAHPDTWLPAWQSTDRCAGMGDELRIQRLLTAVESFQLELFGLHCRYRLLTQDAFALSANLG